jgi:hypothetical protein
MAFSSSRSHSVRSCPAARSRLSIDSSCRAAARALRASGLTRTTMLAAIA